MPKDKRKAGEDFLNEILQHVPEAQRDSVAAALRTDAVLDRIGDGTLRQDVFSREMDALRQSQDRVRQTAEEQRAWYQENKTALEEAATLRERGRRSPGEDDDDLLDVRGRRREEPALKPDDVLRTVAPILGSFEQSGITLMSMLTRISTNHLKEFDEVLDTDKLIAEANEKKITVQQAYDALVAPRRTERQNADLAARLEAAKEEGRKAGLQEAMSRKGVYPVGDGGVPPTLSGIGAKPEDFTLDAAVNDLRELSAKQT